MKKISLILLLIIPFALFCETSDSIKTKKIELGITYAPNYCFRTIKTDATNKWISDALDTIDIAKFGFTTGLNVVYNLNKHFSLSSGVLFSDKGYKTNKIPTGNSLLGTLPTSNTFVYHYQYLDIPLKINYYVLTKKLKFYLTTGISANIFISDKTKTIIGYSDKGSEINKSKATSQLLKTNFTFIAGIGIDCPLTDKANFKIEPFYNRSINSIVNSPLKNYLYSYGLNIGFFLKL